ncbi:hypothetical protein ACOMHN_026048 [Nucella lapillus]
MPGCKYRLTYFGFKGRAELIRLIFHAARVPFEDRRIALADWSAFKEKHSVDSLPILEMNGETFAESGAIVNWAARKFGLMGKTDAEQLKTEAIVIQATEFREKYIIPCLVMETEDPEKMEALKQKLEAAVGRVFSTWEARVLQTESTARKVFSYMGTQSMTVADLAVLYVADLTEAFISVDWTRFPRLHAVIHTLTHLPHLQDYLTSRDNPDRGPNTLVTPRSLYATPRAEPQATPKQHTSSMPVETPRAKATARNPSVKQKA